MTEDRKVEFVKSYLLPRLDQRSTGDAKEQHLEEVEQLLAEAYLAEGTTFISGILKSVLPVLLIDVVFHIPAVVYGLVLSMTGTWFLMVHTDLLDRFSIATQSEYSTGATYGGRKRLDVQKAERLAENTVLTNIGLIWLSLGFLIQIIAAIFFPGASVVQQIL
ncbi:hypothetical protein [Natrarchaeobius chitinivorans]|uniref:hypothetical protein n=1 Tax=Natrarchaeobius chitinivorans TaxID=1679083 RepID=UPI000F523F49|nr:hypothetical protein [Natrarchaeobius chitinivorans]